jgi:hypothetical protein
MRHFLLAGQISEKLAQANVYSPVKKSFLQAARSWQKVVLKEAVQG